MEDPSSIISRQIDMLLSRHNMFRTNNTSQQSSIFTKLQKKNQLTKHIFLKVSKQKQTKNNVTPSNQLQEQISQERSRLTNNESKRRLKQNQKIKKKCSAEFRISNESNRSIRRYNMNKDMKINLGEQIDTHNIYKPLTPKKKMNFQEKLVRARRKNQIQNIGKSQKDGNETSKLSSTLKLKNMYDKFEFQYEIEKPKEYFPKRKFWTSAKVIISRQSSPQDMFTITNTRASSSDKRMYHKSLVQNNLQTTQTIQQQSNHIKSQYKRKRVCRKQRLTDCNEVTEELQTRKKKFLTKGRHCKQLFFNKIFKSKTEGLRQQQSICPWSMPEERFKNHPSIREYQEIEYYM